MNEHLTSITRSMTKESIDKSFVFFKERVCEDILSFELSFLYNKRVYGPQANTINDIFYELSKEVDEILNHNHLVLKKSLDELFKNAVTKCVREVG